MKRKLKGILVCAESLAMLASLAACQNAKKTETVEESLLAAVYADENKQYADAVKAIASVEESREIVSIAESEAASIEESIAASIEESSREESRSIEESSKEESISVEQSRLESLQQEENERASIEASSIQESIERESESIQASIEASVAASIEASVAESIRQSQEQMEQQMASGEFGHLIPGQVTAAATKDDIPYLRRLFANTVVIGDSRAKGSVDCGLLTENEVSFYGGASVHTLYDTTIAGAGKMRKKALFIVGLNDMGYYHCDANAFKEDYRNLINTYLSINPNSQIYLLEILPVFEEGRWAWPKMDIYPEFNQAVKNLAAECGYTLVSANQYATKDMINSDDFAHYGLKFYLLWGQTVANQMGLWEDLQ